MEAISPTSSDGWALSAEVLAVLAGLLDDPLGDHPESVQVIPEGGIRLDHVDAVVGVLADSLQTQP